MLDELNLNPVLALFASPDEKATFNRLSTGERQRLIADLERRLDAWRAQLLQPTREQMLAVTHQENRAIVQFRQDTPEFWDGLEAEWRRKQVPSFVPVEGDPTWSREATVWLEQQRRSGQLFRDFAEANEAYLQSTGSNLIAETASSEAASAPNRSDREETSQLLSNYVHVKTIGRGAFAIVTHYRDKTSGADVAVKKLTDEKHAHRFEREIKIMQALDGHPNVIKLIDFECISGSYQHITPKAKTNLYKYIKKINSTLTLERRIGIFDQVLAALNYAHSKNILHRDIAPTNVLVFENEHIEVCDFGMGKDLSALSNYTTSVVARYGQLYYVAPEQREKLKAASERSDIYSLGKLLNFVLTGRDPDTIHPSDFTSVIERATQYDPDARYQNIQEFETAYNRLKSLLLVDTTSALPKTLIDLARESGSIDWREFHNLAARSDLEGHTYSDYVDPVVELLSQPGNLQTYYETVGDAFGDFLKIFVAKLVELAGMTGWPFKEITTFGRLLKNIFFTVHEPGLKLICLKEIWNLAYEQDQWAVQSIMQGLFDHIPGDIQTAFALHILDSSASSLPDSSKATIPRIIKQALVRKANELDAQRKRAILRSVVVALNDDERDLLKLFGSPRSQSDEFDHPFLQYNVYRSVDGLVTNGVLNRDLNAALAEHQERIALVPEAKSLVEEFILEDKVQRESIVLDLRNIAASGAAGSGAPPQVNRP
jgi:eukaryotic-like serine/threonine-protein kinase